MINNYLVETYELKKDWNMLDDEERGQQLENYWDDLERVFNEENDKWFQEELEKIKKKLKYITFKNVYFDNEGNVDAFSELNTKQKAGIDMNYVFNEYHKLIKDLNTLKEKYNSIEIDNDFLSYYFGDLHKDTVFKCYVKSEIKEASNEEIIEEVDYVLSRYTTDEAGETQRETYLKMTNEEKLKLYANTKEMNKLEEDFDTDLVINFDYGNY